MKSASKALGAGRVSFGTIGSEQPTSYRVSEHAIFRYGVAVLSVAASLFLTLSFGSYTFRTPLFFPAIILSTWVGGAGPGLFAVLLSTLSINYFILEPKFALAFSVRDILHLSAFLLSALLVSSWSAARKRAEQALQRARADLETKVEERTEKLRKLNDELLGQIAERTSAQEQLRQTERRLRDVIVNAPVVLFSLDRSGVVTLSEGKGLETFGVEPGQLVGRSIFDLYHDSPDLHSHARRALAGEPVTFTTEALNQFFEIHLIPLLNKSGEVASVTGVTYNITDRRKAERDLRLVVDTIPAMAWTTLPDGPNEYCSKRWMEYTGMTPEDVLEYGWLEAFHPEDREAHIARWRTATQSGTLFESEARIRGVDGVYRWFLTQGVPLRDEAGKITRWYGTCVDIDERKLAEEAVREKANLLDLAHESVFVRDRNNVITYWNRGAEEQYGWTSAEAVGQVSHQLTQTVFPAPLAEIEAELLRTGRWDGELIHTRRDGTQVVVASRWSLERDEANNFIAVLETNNDVTERKQAEALLAGEKRLLEMIARGDSLTQILDDLCRLVETQCPDVLASVLLMDANGKQLRHGAAPALPKAYTEAIDGAVIGPRVGSCGTAAYCRQQVIVSDIAADPLWTDFRELAFAHSLRACWSTPIFSSDNKVLGTFALYYREPRSPGPREQDIIEQITHLAGVAIQRKQAEEALRQSEGFLADGQRISHTGSWSWNVSTGKVAWSEEHFRIFGFASEKTEPSFELFLETVHPDDRSFIEQGLNKAIREKSGFDMEFRIALADGSIKHVQGVGRPTLGKSGEVDYYIGTTADITERKRGEALFAGEKRLLEMIATGVALKEILNALCLVIEEYRSGTLASVLLLQPDGFHMDSVAGPSLPKAWTQQMEKLPIGPCAGSCGTAAYRGTPVIVSDIATDPLWELPEHRESALSHGLRASWSNPILSSKGKVLGTFCIYHCEPRRPSAQDLGLMEKATDLARVAIERDRAEEALRNSEEKYRDLINASPDAICVTDADTKCVLVNPAAVELAGRPEEELIGGFLADTYLPEERHLLEARFEKLKAEGSVRFERKFARSNGEVIPVEVSVSSLHGRYFQAIIRDISQRKRAEEALRASEQVARGQVEAMTYSLDVLATAPAPDRFLGQMLSTIGRLLDAQSVILWLFDEANDSLDFRAMAQGANLATADPEHPFVKDALAWKADDLLREAIFTSAPVICEDTEHDPRISRELRDYFRSKGTKKHLTIPTLVAGRVKGFIGIRHESRAPYRPEEIELAQALAHQAMLAIQLTDLAEQGRKAAVLGERNRMARDIHDTLAQGFTGVIVQLEAVADAISSGDHKEAENYLHRASELARQSLNEARRSVHALRPEALRRANFWEALKGIIKNTTAGNAICTKMRLRGKLPELPNEWQENLMHIGQEALTNTLKYAHADFFETQLFCNAKELRLVFEDDGDGFEVKDGHDGFGLAGMRERVEQMGGELKIASARGKGTKVAVLLPLNGNSMS